jgi:hypothetical protein
MGGSGSGSLLARRQAAASGAMGASAGVGALLMPLLIAAGALLL